MVAPGKWQELGPGAATGGASFGHSPALGARNVGHMLPDKSAGPMAEIRSDGTLPRLGIKLKRG